MRYTEITLTVSYCKQYIQTHSYLLLITQFSSL